MAERARVAVLISGRGSQHGARCSNTAPRSERPYEIVLVASNDPEARGLELAERLGIPTWALSHKGMTREEFERADRRGAARPRRRDGRARRLYAAALAPNSSRSGTGGSSTSIPRCCPNTRASTPHGGRSLAGDEHAGCSVHVVTDELDDGPVLAQAKVAILPGDDAETLAARVLMAEHQLYPLALDEYCRACARVRKRRWRVTDRNSWRRPEAAATAPAVDQLAEIVAVAVADLGLALWNGYRRPQRRSRATRPSERTQAPRPTATDRWSCARRRPRRQAAGLAPPIGTDHRRARRSSFPTALGVAPVETLADPRIEASWFRRALLARRRRKRPATASPRCRCAITTRFYRDGAQLTDTAVDYSGLPVRGRRPVRRPRGRAPSRPSARADGPGDPAVAAPTPSMALWPRQRGASRRFRRA